MFLWGTTFLNGKFKWTFQSLWSVFYRGGCKNVENSKASACVHYENDPAIVSFSCTIAQINSVLLMAQWFFLMKSEMTRAGSWHIHEEQEKKKIFFVGHIKPTNFVKQTDLQPHLRAEDPRAHAKPKQTKVLTLNPIRNNAKWRKNLRKMGTAHCVHWSNQTNRLDTSSTFLNTVS